MVFYNKLLNNERYKRFREYQINGREQKTVAVKTLPETECLNCGMHFQGRFCPSCGQSASTRRINSRQTFSNIFATFSKFDDKLWHTTFDLFVRPGFMINDYFKGRRAQYIKPLQMLICLITAYLFITMITGVSVDSYRIFDDILGNQIRKALPDDVLRGIYDSVAGAFESQLFRTLFNITIKSFTCYLFFRLLVKKKRLNYAEHFYTHVYTQCIYMIINLLLIPFCIIFNKGTFEINIGYLGEALIMMLVYAQIFRITWRRSFMAFFLADILFLVFLILLLLLTMGFVFGLHEAKVI